MFNSLVFVVPGPPVPWARARGAGAVRFTAAPQKAFKNTVAQYAWAAILAAGGKPGRVGVTFLGKGVPLALCAKVFLPVPPSYDPDLRRACLAHAVRPVVKPDLDNWIKLPMDAMNALVWHDDAQVVDFDGSGKWYAEKPRLEITVRRV